VPNDAVSACSRPPLIYLLTGEQAVAYCDGPQPRPWAVALFRKRTTYFIDSPGASEFITTNGAFLKAHGNKAETVFLSSDGLLRVSRISRKWP
jgi:hypothetical protein